MKKTLTTTLLAILTCVCMAFGFAGLGAITAFAADDLTVTIDTNESVTLTDADSDGYYDINTADDLYAFAALVNSGSTDINGELTANIVVNENLMEKITVADDGTATIKTGETVRIWKPIGNYDRRYTGTFDGKNFTVSGLYFNDGNTNYVGLFGFVGQGGKVRNVGVIDSYFCGNEEVGGVVGYNWGAVTNCYNTGTVSGNEDVGGVVGLNDDSVTNCYNTVTVSGNEKVGGVVGYNWGAVTNCYNTGKVSGTDNYVGGVVGYHTKGTVTNCYNTGSVSGDYYVGGVMGVNGSTVTNCYNTGSVSGNRYVGSVMVMSAYNDVPAENCYYLADSDDGNGGKTTTQFASGEVAWLLNGSTSEGDLVWGQTIGKDDYPVLGGLRIYQVTNCASGDYSNNTTGEHFGGTATCTAGEICNVCGEEYGEVDADNHTSDTYTNGFRDCCGGYQPATQNAEGYYEIGNLGQLMWFAENAASTKHNVILTADITIDNSVVWTPMTLTDGNANSIFDGDGHTITFANTNEGSTFGLFGTYNYSFIKNLKLAGSITCNTTDNVGALVNSAYRTTISNVISTCNITNTASSGDVGGLAGYFGGKHADGLYSLIENCAVYADITGGGNVGGLVGQGWNGTQYWDITNAAYVGNVTGTNAGAIIGYHATDSNTCTFTNIYWCEDDGLGLYGKRDTENQVYTNTSAKTSEQFASGEVAYLLQGEQADEVWGQTLSGENNDAFPVFNNGSNTVYQIGNTGCTVGYDAYIYSNDESTVYAPAHTEGTAATCAEKAKCDTCENFYGEKLPHNNYNENGFCTACEGYQPATETTDKYDVNGDGEPDTVYEIANAGQLYWFAALVNGGTNFIGNDVSQNASANAVLVGNIDLNPGYTFAFIPDTGLVEVKKDSTVVAYLGTGIKGDASGANTAFDKTAATMGAVYKNADDTEADTVDLAAIRAWTPIGNESNKYTGTFDGKGYTVSGIYINNTALYQGLFGYVGTNGRVQNVTVASSYVKGGQNVGGVVGLNYGAVENSHNTGFVSSSYICVGGVVGNSRESGTVTNCYNTGSVSGNNYYVGGVVGLNNGAVENSYNAGTVSGTRFVGGLVGYTIKSTITNCYNIGAVSGGSDVGGVAGLNGNTITNCYSTSTLVGNNSSGTVTHCEANVSVERFASGEIAYKLNGSTSDGTLVWGQSINEDAYPVLGGAKVYYGYLTLACNEVKSYTNDSTISAVKNAHDCNENGFCKVCGGYQPATETTDKYDLNGDGELDTVYEIGNAGQLYWFAALVNGDTYFIGNDVSQNASANAVLIDDIDLNPGYTFTFIPDTGLVEVKKDNAVVAYLGMGIKGDTSGSDTAFDETASEAGKIYVYDAKGGYTESAEALDSLNTWTPIGNYDIRYLGIFDGQGHTVSGLYFNNNTSGSVGLFGVIGWIDNPNGKVQNVGVIDSYISGNQSVGGVVGYTINATVTNCYNTGSVSGSGDYIGGVVGSNDFGTVSNCYNTGSVKGSGNVGGVVGFNGCTVENCYNTGSVKGSSNVGGVVGTSNGTVQNCYYLADSDDDNDGKTAAQFASGEVAYLLQGEQVDQVWGQTLSGQTVDAYPVFNNGANSVYQIENTGCTEGYDAYVYSNDESTVYAPAHTEGTAATCTAPAVCSACQNEYGEALGHDMSEATCTAPATCKRNCGFTDGEALGHDMSEATCTAPATCKRNCGHTEGEALGHDYESVVIEPTCTEAGYTTYTCSVCGDTYVDDEVGALGHDYDSVVTEPTCTEAGYTTYTCSVCGDTYVDDEVGALGHDYDSVVTEPTCTEAGYTTYTCSVCGDTYVDDEVGALGHDYDSVVTEPTCTVIGNISYTCSVCGDDYDEEVAALGHDWKDADCTTPKTCEICGETDGEALGHDMGEATCTAPATCKRNCGHTEGDALGHDWKDADCTTPKTCEICEETEGAALGHDWNDADCTTPKTCEVCEVTEGAALGHDMGEATCTAPATCKRNCGHTEGDALGHDWKDADCTTPKTCEICEETEGAALGHDWNDADCTTPKTCKTCGETDGEALGHDWADADCTTPKTCKTCGETDGNALGHNYGEWMVTKEATETEKGSKTKTCACGDTITEEIPMLENEGLSGGAIAGIVVGSVAVVGIGGFSSFWFVIKKKTWAELIAIFKKK